MVAPAEVIQALRLCVVLTHGLRPRKTIGLGAGSESDGNSDVAISTIDLIILHGLVL